jgi:hypothetical protein
MKISGFSICRNAIKFDYPILEAIRSALPLVDEFIVNVGQSDDGTREMIASLDSPKVQIVDSIWDDGMKKDGLLLSHETNVALARCTGDWALYLQADEVLHQRDYETIHASLHHELSNPAVLGFTFRYLHFYADYGTCNPWFYHRAVRVIRNDGQVESCGDAAGFWLKADQGYLQSLHNDRLRPSGGTIYHYGWVKPARVLLDKLRYMVARYHGDEPGPEHARMLQREAYDFDDYDIMKKFTGSHPAVMNERIRAWPMLKPGRNRWLKPAFYRAILKRGFRG